MFKTAKENNVEHVFIYYTGWSCFPTGNWILSEYQDFKNDKLEDDRVSLIDLINAAKASEFINNIDITCDCSFSGEWVHTAKAYFDGHEEKFKMYINAICNRDS